ncbi:MAG: hypothetical protein H7Z42_20275 [Roseiflexaceae bacterium]|nr:hypothetical protein [Roseiflexaceae bacterium]
MLFSVLGARYSLHRHLRQIVLLTYRHGGVTARLEPAELLGAVDIWMFPKYPAKTVIVPPGRALMPAIRTFVQLHRAALCEHDAWLGTWVSPITGYWHIDIATGCSNLDEAQQQAFAYSARDGRTIVALYNLHQRRTVYLGHMIAALTTNRAETGTAPLSDTPMKRYIP